MKTHSTNYEDTFIEVAEDCQAKNGEVPPLKGGEETIASIQFDMIIKNPYKFTSDDVIFQTFARRNNIASSQQQKAREEFFSKGQPCLRASPLTKRYGWGVHSNKEGRIAIYGCETREYKKFLTDKSLKVVKAMRSTR